MSISFVVNTTVEKRTHEWIRKPVKMTTLGLSSIKTNPAD